jgi:hypothetical protein
MSKQQDTGSRLPSPRSPQHLDTKILARARASAPRKRDRGWPVWGGGLATAAVLVTAVYLTQLTAPEPDRPQLEDFSADGEPRMQAPAATHMKRELAQPREMADYASKIAAEPVEEAAGGAAPVDLHEALEQLRQLVSQGELEQARERYAELRASCGDCELPATLDEALAP